MSENKPNKRLSHNVNPPFEAYAGDGDYIFVSYKHDDSHIVYPIIKKLHEAGFNIWFDGGIPRGNNYILIIRNKIKKSSLFINFITKNLMDEANNTKDFCFLEFQQATDKPERILPIYLEDVELDGIYDFFLNRTQGILKHEFEDDDEFINSIITAFKRDYKIEPDIVSKPAQIDNQKPLPDSKMGKNEISSNKLSDESNAGIEKVEKTPKDKKIDFNFSYLDNLIHSCPDTIKLEHDIYFDKDELDFYEDGIELDIDDLVIDGQGHMIDAKKMSCIFRITGNNVTLKNILFRNASFLECGALINFRKAALIDCTFENNYSDTNGGAVYNYGSLVILNCEFDKNESVKGGAIYNKGDFLEISSSRFIRNIADKGNSIFNGIYSQVKIIDCVFGNSRNEEIVADYDNSIICENSNFANESGFSHDGGNYPQRYCKAPWVRASIFIDGTFNDMHAERDFLIKEVFPELMEWCHQRHIDLKPIDLRWGVTEEDSANSNTIQTCLRHIDKCRPFYMCFLGQRRGWVPYLDYDVSHETRERYPEIDRLEGLSATEMGIEHALLSPLRSFFEGRVFDCPPSNSIFFFRDDDYVNEISSAQRLIYTNENEDEYMLADERLAETKEHIRRIKEFEDQKSDDDESKVKVFINDYKGYWDKNLIVPQLITPYFSNDEYRGRLVNFTCQDRPLKEVVIEQIKELFSRAFPYNMLLQDQPFLEMYLNQEDAFCYLNSEGFIPRPTYTRYLEDYVDNYNENKICLVTAEEGYGKTMLLSRFAIDLEEHSYKKVYKRFCGASDLSSQTYTLWKSIMDEADISEDEYFYPKDLDELKRNIPEILDTLTRKGESIIIIDGINQIPNGMDMLNWLDFPLPDNLKIIISINEYKNDMRYDDNLNRIKSRNNICHFEIKEFDDYGKRELIKEYLKNYLKALDDAEIDTICSFKASKNPLYLKILLSELTYFGSFDQLKDKITMFGDSPKSAFNHVLERLESDEDVVEGEPLVPLIFSLLANAGVGLSKNELTAIIKNQTGLDEKYIRDTIYVNLMQVKPFMARKAGRDDFFYESFKLAAQERYAQNQEFNINNILVDYFMAQADPYGNFSFIVDYLRPLNDLPCYLNESKNYDDLAKVLSSFEFIKQKLYLSDIHNLIQDYNFKDTPFNQFEENPLMLIGKALELSSPVLEINKDQLPAQLWGRLNEIDDDTIKNLCDELLLNTQDTWLKSKTNSLYSPESIIIKRINANGRRRTTAIAMTANKILIGNGDGTLNLFDIERNELLVLDESDAEIIKIILIDDNEAIVGYSNGMIKIWDINNKFVINEYPQIDSEITDISFLESYGKIYLSSYSGVYSIDLETEEVRKEDIEQKDYDNILVSHRNNQILLSTEDEVEGFDVYEMRRKFHRFYHENEDDSFTHLMSYIEFIGLINKFLILISTNGEMKIWNTLKRSGDGESIDEAQVCSPNDRLNLAKCLEDENEVITISDMGVMRVWDIPQPRKPKFNIAIEIQTGIKSPTAIDYFHNENNRWVIVGNENNDVSIIDLNKKINEYDKIRHNESVLSIEIDDNHMITASENGEIYTWDFDNEEFINRFSNEFRCNAISYNRNDSKLVLAGRKTEMDGRIINKIATCDINEDMWKAIENDYFDIELDAEDYKITGSEIIDVAQTSSGIAFIEEDKLTIGDYESKLDKFATALAGEFNSDNVFVGFEDGSIVGYPSGNSFDADINSPVTKIKIFKDKLIAGYEDGSVVIFGGIQTTHLKEHEKAITDIYVDDSQLISLSEDNTVKFWNMDSRECLYTHFLDIFATSINKKGDKIVIGDTLGNVVFFNFENL